MYETHFGFHRQPFQSADACRAFFVSESIREILPQLIHALRSDLGVAVLTGVPGSGKTSLLRHLQQQLSSDGRVVVCSGANLGTSSDLIGVLLQASRLTGGSESAINGIAVDRPSPTTRTFAFDHMKRTAELWGPILLLIDDAQLVPLSVLNELRACTEEEWNGRDLVRCLVSAPISFEEQLARSEYAEFSRRIRCHAFLQPLTSSESIRFLKEQIELVGGQLSNVFTTTALELIATAADGIPRCLGLLADESLVVAAAAGEVVATEQSVRTALSRLQHLQYNWNASPHEDVADETSMESKPAGFEATHA
ncbi:MAG: AAA family ATPase, partial [Planctomycetota bacterium]|nr:AAA family ATPase [Planctomycetota bacterium]